MLCQDFLPQHPPNSQSWFSPRQLQERCPLQAHTGTVRYWYNRPLQPGIYVHKWNCDQLTAWTAIIYFHKAIDYAHMSHWTIYNWRCTHGVQVGDNWLNDTLQIKQSVPSSGNSTVSASVLLQYWSQGAHQPTQGTALFHDNIYRRRVLITTTAPL